MVDKILHSGQVGSKKFNSPVPLMYEWHDKKYYGAAHGICGILFMLLQAGDKYISDDQSNDLIRPTIDYLQSTMFTSGNMPSSGGSDKDK